MAICIATTRRRYCLWATLLLLSFACSSRAEDTQAITGPKLGLQTWTLRHMTFDEVVEFAAANGIRYLQLTSQHLDPNAPLEETLRKKGILDRHGLIAYTFGVNVTSTDKEADRKLFEFARLIGAKVIVVEPAMADWDSLEALVKEYDIKLAIHNHGLNTTYGDPRIVRQVLAARDPRIGVCLDIGWVTAAGYDAAQVFRQYRGRVYDIHFKDKKVDGTVKPSSVVDTGIGQGDANIEGLFAEINQSGWNGVMAIETDSEPFAADPQLFVETAVAVFKKNTTRAEDWEE